MWQVYKRGDIYRIGEETGRLKGIQWHMLCPEEPTIFWDTRDKAQAFATAKRLNTPQSQLRWELVKE